MKSDSCEIATGNSVSAEVYHIYYFAPKGAVLAQLCGNSKKDKLRLVHRLKTIFLTSQFMCPGFEQGSALFHGQPRPPLWCHSNVTIDEALRGNRSFPGQTISG